MGLVYCRVTSPLILLAIAGTFYAGYKLNQRHLQKKLVLFGKELTLAQQYGLVTLCSMPVYYMVGAHGAMFWVLGKGFMQNPPNNLFYSTNWKYFSNFDICPGFHEKVEYQLQPESHYQTGVATVKICIIFIIT